MRGMMTLETCLMSCTYSSISSQDRTFANLDLFNTSFSSHKISTEVKFITKPSITCSRIRAHFPWVERIAETSTLVSITMLNAFLFPPFPYFL